DRRETQGATERKMQNGGHDKRGSGNPENALQRVRAGLLPAEERADAHEQKEQETQRLHPGLVEGRADRDFFARQSFADERERGRDENEKKKAAEDPIVEKERELARQNRFDHGPPRANVEPARHSAENDLHGEKHGGAC